VEKVRDVTFDEDRSTIRTGHGPQVMAAQATSPSPRYAYLAPPTSPPVYTTTPATPSDRSSPTRSRDDFAGVLAATRSAPTRPGGAEPIRKPRQWDATDVIPCR
jgi:hypothetical protein